MGESFVAVADDASSTYWNPAGMSLLKKQEILAEHSVHIQDIAVSRIAYAHPLGSSPSGLVPAWGVSGAYLSLDDMEGRSGNTAQSERTFGASDMVGAISYSHPFIRLPGRISTLGITGKFIQQRIDDRQASSYAADIGVLQTFGRLRCGLVLANVGSNVRFVDESYPLPRTVRLGLAWMPRSWPVVLSTEVDRVRGEKSASYRFGGEYDMANLLALRMGYAFHPEATQRALQGTALGTVSDSEMTRFTGLEAGLGFKLFGYGIDYAFTPYGELGNAHKITVSARF